MRREWRQSDLLPHSNGDRVFGSKQNRWARQWELRFW